MSQSTPTSAATRIIADVEPTVVMDGMSHAPAFTGHQEAPARRHHPSRRSYLEGSCMAREMDRL